MNQTMPTPSELSAALDRWHRERVEASALKRLALDIERSPAVERASVPVVRLGQGSFTREWPAERSKA